MRIDDFVSQSEGEWKSMRSGHSLAFQQFEEILSKIKITLLSKLDPRVLELIHHSNEDGNKVTSPFFIEWEAQTNWGEDLSQSNSSGSSVLIPINKTSNDGIILRSMGYIEPIRAISKYNFLSDGTLNLSTKYSSSIAEERIWFLSENVRCRSSVIRSSNSTSILQTSHASEIRKLFINNENRN